MKSIKARTTVALSDGEGAGRRYESGRTYAFDHDDLTKSWLEAGYLEQVEDDEPAEDEDGLDPDDREVVDALNQRLTGLGLGTVTLDQATEVAAFVDELNALAGDEDDDEDDDSNGDPAGHQNGDAAVTTEPKVESDGSGKQQTRDDGQKPPAIKKAAAKKATTRRAPRTTENG